MNWELSKCTRNSGELGTILIRSLKVTSHHLSVQGHLRKTGYLLSALGCPGQNVLNGVQECLGETGHLNLLVIGDNGDNMLR